MIILSFIACVISFYLLIFGIPSFLFGAVLVFQSTKTTLTKLLTTIIPIAVYVPATFVFLHLYNYSTPKTILIPENFEGILRVVYKEKCGNKYDEIDGEKTLTFLENGILVLNENFDRHINYHYYLIDELGNRTEIKQILNFKDRVRKRPCVLVSGSGTIGETIDADSSYHEKDNITYTDFYVYNKDTIDKTDFKSQQDFNTLTTDIVHKCRQEKKGSR